MSTSESVEDGRKKHSQKILFEQNSLGFIDEQDSDSLQEFELVDRQKTEIKVHPCPLV